MCTIPSLYTSTLIFSPTSTQPVNYTGGSTHYSLVTTPPAVPPTLPSPHTIVHSRPNSHLHQLGKTDDNHCRVPLVPNITTYHRSQNTYYIVLATTPTALLGTHTLIVIPPPSQTITDTLLRGSQYPDLTSKVLKHTRTFLQRSGQLNTI